MLNSSGKQLRAGFTIIEIVVVISVLAVMASLILPAVLAGRESSRAVSCKNNLRQFGVAILGYEATRRELPTSTETRSRSNSRLSEHGLLLPFLDQAAVLDQLLASQRWSASDLALQPSIAIMLCPSDPLATGVSYRFCSGTVPAIYEKWTEGSVQGREVNIGANGAFVHDPDTKGVHLSEIVDGLSQTAAMSERLAGGGRLDRFDRKRDIWFSGAGLLNSVYVFDADAAVGICSAADSAISEEFSPWAGQYYLNASFTNSTYNHVLPPNSKVPDCSLSGLADGVAPHREPPMSTFAAAVKASSYHRSGAVHMLYLDGSIKVVAVDIDLAIWRQMARRDDSSEHSP